MKLAFSTVACMGAPWQKVLAWAVDAGQDAVEIRLSDDGSVFGLAEEDTSEMVHAFQEAGVAISDLGTSVHFSGFDEKMLEPAGKAILLAERTGARGIRVFPGSFVKRFSDDATHDLDGMARFLREVATVAGMHGVEIWIETHNEFATGENMRRLLDRAGSANIKVIWDLIHSCEYGEKPEDTLRLLGGDVAHVHVKDGKKTPDPDRIDYEYTRLGEGELPLNRMFRLLCDAGYEGYFSLEWENAWRPEIRGVYASTPALLSNWNDFIRCVGGKKHE